MTRALLIAIGLGLCLPSAATAKRGKRGKRKPATESVPQAEPTPAAAVAEPPAVAPPTQPTSPSPAPGPLTTLKPRLAVIGFQSSVITDDELRALEDAVSSAAGRYTAMDVIAAADMRAMLNLGATQGLLGCDDGDCLTQFGNLLKVQQMLTGTVASMGDGLQISLRLLDMVNGKVIKSVSVEAPSDPRAMVKVATTNVATLFGVVARIAIWNQPDNAEVFLDGSLVGATPVSYVTVRSAGEHQLTIDGPGITRWDENLEVNPGVDLRIRALNQNLRQVEIEASDRRQFAAWTGAGAVVGAVATGLLLGLAAKNDARLDSLDRRRVTQSELDSITSTTFGYTIGALATGAIGAGLAGISLYSALVNPAQDTLDAQQR